MIGLFLLIAGLFLALGPHLFNGQVLLGLIILLILIVPFIVLLIIGLIATIVASVRR